MTMFGGTVRWQLYPRPKARRPSTDPHAERSSARRSSPRSRRSDPVRVRRRRKRKHAGPVAVPSARRVSRGGANPSQKARPAPCLQPGGSVSGDNACALNRSSEHLKHQTDLERMDAVGPGCQCPGPAQLNCSAHRDAFTLVLSGPLRKSLPSAHRRARRQCVPHQSGRRRPCSSHGWSPVDYCFW